MSDLSEVGTVAFWINEPADWATNDSQYRFPEIELEGVRVLALKYLNKTLEIRISGPFSKQFRFVAGIPECGPKGLFVMLAWSAGQLTLFLNAKKIETKDRDSPYLAWEGQAFSSKTDLATRTLEQAIAFDISANRLTEMILEWPQHILQCPQLLCPIVVCDAFSIELYLKYFHHADHKTSTKGHNLEKLFSGLESATQQRIRDVYDELLAKKGPFPSSGVSFKFDDVMASCSIAFEMWRYANELGQSDQNYFGILKGAIKTVAQQRCPAAFDRETPTPQPTSPPQ